MAHIGLGRKGGEGGIEGRGREGRGRVQSLALRRRPTGVLGYFRINTEELVGGAMGEQEVTNINLTQLTAYLLLFLHLLGNGPAVPLMPNLLALHAVHDAALTTRGSPSPLRRGCWRFRLTTAKQPLIPPAHNTQPLTAALSH